MAPADIKPINEPRDFKDHELFFSLTDKKAIIKYGNHIFCRIAAYEEIELYDKPHNIIRHPDMPRAAFKIVWDRLLSNKHVFAYVKNLAKDGRYYWVMAAILPTQNGYLSIRLKPSSDLFDKIPEIYSQIRKKELAIEEKDSRKRKEAISEGIKELQEILSKLGFKNYEEFMNYAFLKEILQREENLRKNEFSWYKVGEKTLCSLDSNRIDSFTIGLRELTTANLKLYKALDGLFNNLNTLQNISKNLLEYSEYTETLNNKVRLLAMNASILAKRISGSTNTLSIVSNYMGSKIGLNDKVMKEVKLISTPLTSKIGQLLILLSVSKVILESIFDFLTQISTSHYNADTAWRVKTSIYALNELIKEWLEKCMQNIENVQEDIDKALSLVESLERIATELKFIQFAGVVESAKLSDKTSFTYIFENIGELISKNESKLTLLGSLVTEGGEKIREAHLQKEGMKTTLQRLLIEGKRIEIRSDNNSDTEPTQQHEIPKSPDVGSDFIEETAEPSLHL